MVSKAKNSAETVSRAPVSQGVGRRKSAVARVWLRRGNGKMLINGRDYAQYFDTEFVRSVATEAFRACAIATSFDVAVNVAGGGLHAQAGAVKLGMARALVKFDAELKPILKPFGLLTVDSRIKERKKPGQKAARRKFQFVKR